MERRRTPGVWRKERPRVQERKMKTLLLAVLAATISLSGCAAAPLTLEQKIEQEKAQDAKDVAWCQKLVTFKLARSVGECLASLRSAGDGSLGFSIWDFK